MTVPQHDSPESDDVVDIALRSLDRAEAMGAADRIMLAVERRRRGRRYRRLAVTSAAGCIIAGIAWFRFPVATAEMVDAGRAVVSGPASQKLPDGSIIEIRPGATFSVEFTDTQRRIFLRSGEAHFSVVRDITRPFIVHAGEVVVQALGTTFAVENASASVTVFVTSGRVAVSAPFVDARASQTAELTAGQRATVSLSEERSPSPLVVADISSMERAEYLSWRVSRIEFSGTPLGEAILLFNCQAGTRFELDPALADLRLGGSLRADDTEALLLLLRTEFDITPEPQPDGAILLRRR